MNFMPERLHANHPLFREGPDQREAALIFLDEMNEARRLATMLQAMQPVIATWQEPPRRSVLRAARNAGIDAYAALREALDEMIRHAAILHDINRADLPTTGEIAMRLAA